MAVNADGGRREAAGHVRVRAREAAIVERELAAWRQYFVVGVETQEQAAYVPGWIRTLEAMLEALGELDFGEPTDHKRIEVSWARFDPERCRRVSEDEMAPKRFVAGWGAVTQGDLDRHRIAVMLWRPLVRDETTTRPVAAVAGLDACVERMWLPWLPPSVADPAQLVLDLGEATA